MFRTLRYLAVAMVAVLALAVPSFAAQAKPAAATVTKAKTMTVTGTLQKVDRQDLTIQTAKGSEDVMFGNDVRVMRSGKALTTSDLNSATGSRVTVRYTEDNGHKMAQSVTLAAAKAAAAPKKAAPASASANTATATPGTKK